MQVHCYRYKLIFWFSTMFRDWINLKNCLVPYQLKNTFLLKTVSFLIIEKPFFKVIVYTIFFHINLIVYAVCLKKKKIRIYSEIKPGEKNFILCCILFLFIIFSLFQDFHFSNKMFVYMIVEHMPRFQRITWTGIVYQN